MACHTKKAAILSFEKFQILDWDGKNRKGVLETGFLLEIISNLIFRKVAMAFALSGV
jgi:hypothetical protein